QQLAPTKASWREFLLAVGVQDTLDPVWIIQQIVLPRHEGEDWRSLDDDELLQDLDFVRRCASQYQEWARLQQPVVQRPSYSAYRELGRMLWIRTKRTEGNTGYYDHAPSVYLPTEARIQADLEALFPPSV